MNRELAAAIVISLSGHAALIGVLGVLPDPAPFAAPSASIFVAAPGMQSSTRVILTAPESPSRVSPPPVSGAAAVIPDSFDYSGFKAGESPADLPSPEPSPPDPSPAADILVAEASVVPGFAGSQPDRSGFTESPGNSGGTGMSDSPHDSSESEGESQTGGRPGPGSLNNSASSANTFPVLITSLTPDYPMMARRSGLEGEVTIEITVDSDGMPTDCRVLPPFSHRILEESAVRAVKNARFQPGTRNGQPAACTYSIKVRFELSPENT